jgi:hypothetical protein
MLHLRETVLKKIKKKEEILTCYQPKTVGAYSAF